MPFHDIVFQTPSVDKVSCALLPWNKNSLQRSARRHDTDRTSVKAILSCEVLYLSLVKWGGALTLQIAQLTHS